jgi:hypothetical protein
VRLYLDQLHSLSDVLFPRDLSIISDKLYKVTSRGAVRRFFTAEDDAANISQLVREINQLIQSFQVRTTTWCLRSPPLLNSFDWQLDGIISVEVTVHVSNFLRLSPYCNHPTYTGAAARL